MGEKVYRIKALEWESGHGHCEVVAKSVLGTYYISPIMHGKFRAGPAMYQLTVDSIADGKARCEALYRERMERGLEVVDGR